MKQLNVVGFETRFGFRTIELYHGDIVQLDPIVDILVVSAFAGGYVPVPGTVFGALNEQHGLDARELARDPDLDLRGPLGVWLSKPLAAGPSSRMLCVHLRGGRTGLRSALDDAFAALLLVGARDVAADIVALPLLATGHQKVDADWLVGELVNRGRLYLERAVSTTTLRFVEIDRNKAELIADSMDRLLGRKKVTVPQATLTDALLADVRDRLMHTGNLFDGLANRLKSDWILMLQANAVESVQFGVNARKLVELILDRLGVPAQQLYKRIRRLEQQKTAAPRICGHMHVLRHLGNDAVHDLSSNNHIPTTVEPSDLIAGLHCVQRLLDFYAEHQESSR